MVVSVLAVALFARCVTSTSSGTNKILWTCCGVAALLAVLHTIIQWTKTSPAELYDEQRQKNLNKSKNAELDDEVPLKFSSWSSGSKLGLVISVLSLACLLYIRFADLGALGKTDRAWACLQLAGVALMLGLAMFLSIELTFLSTPDALSVQRSARVSWAGTARLAMLISIMILACCLTQFITKNDVSTLDSTQRTVHFAAKAFGLILLLSTFTVWIVPRRLAAFQKSGKIPKDWISLTLTSWLGMFAFVVAATLPADWPWRLLGK
ncbi:MAG: hypothetical protein U0930_22225 [Pirellulales bacterium]